MISSLKAFLAAILLLLLLPVAAQAAADPHPADPRMVDHVLGKASALIKVDEYVSLTCSHCADFYNNILPEIEKRYVDTGKARFILHDFPTDGVSLRASAIARCMPADEYFPFIGMLYKNQMTWAFGGGDPEKNLIQYAKLGGLSEDKAKACANDNALFDAMIASSKAAADKYQITGTPTFIINDGEAVLNGAQPVDQFAAAFDKILSAKKK